MSELAVKVWITGIIPVIISLTGYFQSRGFDVELMYWGALGQALALIVQFADQRKKSRGEYQLRGMVHHTGDLRPKMVGRRR